MITAVRQIISDVWALPAASKLCLAVWLAMGYTVAGMELRSWLKRHL